MKDAQAERSQWRMKSHRVELSQTTAIVPLIVRDERDPVAVDAREYDAV
jgi:hypothetical protein